ncbi:hypothetical protein [Bacillus cereus]|uniref:hypothetical protein n=1 Tax=Bacillus cereus TaxID=1396 RepID=UPI00144437BB|nr:hypothetical protein [Bacillus cereus]MEB8944805.1 hypothetical protein [Bacillus cereus]NKX61507.1 hypothetical protein [Bacillus cereus]
MDKKTIGFAILGAILIFVISFIGWTVLWLGVTWVISFIFNVSYMRVFIISSIVYVLLIITKILLAYIGSQVLDMLTEGYRQHFKKKC